MLESMGTDTEVVLSTQNSVSPGSRENPFIFPGDPAGDRKGRVRESTGSGGAEGQACL